MEDKTIKHQFWDFRSYVAGLEAYREKNKLSEYFESIELYRGQPDASEIVASLFRDQMTPDLPEVEKVRWLLKLEYQNVCSWFSRANKAGFAFNFDIHPYVNWNIQTIEEFVGLRPGIEKHFGALSLSRHFGCKNRLIDVTKDGMAALYFAVSSAFETIEAHIFRQMSSDGSIAPDKLSHLKEWLRDNYACVWVMLKGKSLKNAAVIVPDYGNNKFAHAQSALFLMAPEYVVEGETTLQSLTFSKNIDTYGFRLKDKVYIPYQSIPNIIFDMERFGYNLISFMPSPNNISANEVFLNRVKRIHNIFQRIQIG